MTSLVRKHDFNTRWWGEPAGIVDSLDFFQCSRASQTAELEPYSWVEFKAPAESPGLDLRAINQAGFFQVDTQINYRLKLPSAMRPGNLDSLEVEFADQSDFRVSADDIQSFRFERYFKLPGATEERVNLRYAQWSNEQIEACPSTCLRVVSNGRVEGWYLGEAVQGTGLHLTLAMLGRESEISGLLLFLKAYEAFASRGHRLGWAAFSVMNSPVHNIYAAIGARFLAPTGCWLWVRDRSPEAVAEIS